MKLTSSGIESALVGAGGGKKERGKTKKSEEVPRISALQDGLEPTTP